MPGTIPSFITAIRKRPEHERRILAVATYLAGCAVILALGAASIIKTLSLGGSPGAASAIKESTGAAAPTPAITSDSRPVGPLQAFREVLRAAGTGSKNLIAELYRAKELAPPPGDALTGTPTGGTPTAPLPATPQPVLGTAEAIPVSVPGEKAASPIAVNIKPAGPAKIIADALDLPLHSNYAVARLLATPLEAKVRPPTSAPAKKTSYIGEVVQYNLGELKRTGKDVYEYFTR